MARSVPVREMKSTAEFTALVQNEGDVTVTKNGYDAIHCLNNERYRVMSEAAAKADLFSRMLLAEEEISRGDYVPYDDFVSDVKARYGL